MRSADWKSSLIKGVFHSTKKSGLKFRNVWRTSRDIPKFPKFFREILGIFKNGKRPKFESYYIVLYSKLA